MFGSKIAAYEPGVSTPKYKMHVSHGQGPAMPRPVASQKRDTKILNHNLGKAMNSYDTIRHMVERGDKVVSPAGNVASTLQKSSVHINL